MTPTTTTATVLMLSLLIYQYFRRLKPVTNTVTNATTDLRHDATTGDTLLRQHTIASITLEAGTAKRSVQRWLAKCGDIGALKDGTRYFSDSEKEQIISHQSKPRAKQEETIEAELVEPGAIELHTGNASTTAPLMNFDLAPIQLDMPTADITALQLQTEQLDKAAQQGANAISSYFAARMDVGLAQIAAEQDNLLKGIRANALNVGARSVSEASSNAH